MASWDVFHSDRLEVERGLSTGDVRTGLAHGVIHEDDLVRPAGTTVPWMRLNEWLEQVVPETEVAPTIETPATSGGGTAATPPAGPVGESTPAAPPDEPAGEFDLDLSPSGSRVNLPEGHAGRLPGGYDAWPEMGDPASEDDEAAEFTLARGAAETIDELDLAAMVDVAFQMVLFFMVTAATVVYKTMEVPPPPKDAEKSEKVAQGAQKMEDMQKTFILVEIDAAGTIRIDKEPAPVAPEALAERLRQARDDTGRTKMMLQAAGATQHRNAVHAYDAAMEIGLGIALAKPVTAAAPQ